MLYVQIHIDDSVHKSCAQWTPFQKTCALCSNPQNMAMDPIAAALADPAFTHPSPECFGPAMWATIHNIARTYSPDKPLALRAFMTSLADLFPCAKCAPHFQAAVKSMPVDSTAAVLKWSIDFHNSVNARIGKPVRSYPETLAAIQNNCKAETTQWSTLAKVLLPLFLAAVIASIVMGIMLGTAGDPSA